MSNLFRWSTQTNPNLHIRQGKTWMILVVIRIPYSFIVISLHHPNYYFRLFSSSGAVYSSWCCQLVSWTFSLSISILCYLELLTLSLSHLKYQISSSSLFTHQSTTSVSSLKRSPSSHHNSISNSIDLTHIHCLSHLVFSDGKICLLTVSNLESYPSHLT